MIALWLALMQDPAPQPPAPPAPPPPAVKVKKPKKAKKVTNPKIPDLPPKVDPANAVEQKLDGPLLSLVRSLKSGGMEKALAEASASKLADSKNRVKIDITLVDAAQMKDMEVKIREAHGEIVTSLDNRVFAWLPLDAIEPLAAATSVWSLAAVRDTVVQQQH
jgi:hypothetical protein